MYWLNNNWVNIIVCFSCLLDYVKLNYKTEDFMKNNYEFQTICYLEKKTKKYVDVAVYEIQEGGWTAEPMSDSYIPSGYGTSRLKAIADAKARIQEHFDNINKDEEI